MRIVRSLILAAGVAAFAGAASAQGLLDNFQVKVGVSGVMPDESATISTIGGVLQVGFDYRFDEHWAINVDVRKIWISTDVTLVAGATINADVDINPLVVTVATGYRF